MPASRIPDDQGKAMAAAYRNGDVLATLEYRFGWSQTAIRKELARRGVEMRKAARRATTHLWPTWREEYRSGLSLYQIANRYNVTAPSVRYALQQMGEPRRPRGSPQLIDMAAAREMSQRGLSSSEIGRELGFTASAIRARFHKARRAEQRA